VGWNTKEMDDLQNMVNELKAAKAIHEALFSAECPPKLREMVRGVIKAFIVNKEKPYPSLKLSSVLPYRSNSKVNMPNDMVRISLDCKRKDWPKIKRDLGLGDKNE